MKRRVFILGAGASRFANYPLANELWSFVRGNSGRFAPEEHREVTEYIETVIANLPPDEHDQPNLEYLCTLLDVADQGIGPIVVNKPWKAVRPKFIRMITEAFLHHQFSFRSEKHNVVLDTWVKLLRAGDIIITFNWDILQEVALWEAGKWKTYDGYGFSDPNAPKAASPTTILKLHGSTNWTQSHESDHVPTVENNAVFFYAENRPHKIGLRDCYLITPTYLKDISTNALLLHLWNRAADAIANATNIIVIGYRLDRADALARQLIALAILRNTALEKIVVVSPDGSQWDSLAVTLGKQRILVRRKFEEWILDRSSSSDSPASISA